MTLFSRCEAVTIQEPTGNKAKALWNINLYRSETETDNMCKKSETVSDFNHFRRKNHRFWLPKSKWNLEHTDLQAHAVGRPPHRHDESSCASQCCRGAGQRPNWCRVLLRLVLSMSAVCPSSATQSWKVQIKISAKRDPGLLKKQKRRLWCVYIQYVYEKFCEHICNCINLWNIGIFRSLERIGCTTFEKPETMENS